MGEVMQVVDKYYKELMEEKGLGLETHILFPSQESFKDEGWNRLYPDTHMLDLFKKVTEFKKDFPFDDFRSIIVDRKINKKHVATDSFFAYTLYNERYPINVEDAYNADLPSYISVICLKHKGVYSVLPSSLVDCEKGRYVVALPHIRKLGFFLRVMPKEELSHVYVRVYKTDSIKKHYPLMKNINVNNLFISIKDVNVFLNDTNLTDFVELRGNDIVDVRHVSHLKQIGGATFKPVIYPSLVNPEMAELKNGFKVYRGDRRIVDGLPSDVREDELMWIRSNSKNHHYIQYMRLLKA